MKITSQYLHQLQAVYHKIDSRGILVNKERLKHANDHVNSSILTHCSEISKLWGVTCYIGSGNKPSTGASINLNASSGNATSLEHLKGMGFKIPKISARDEEGNYIAKESLNELVLQKIYATNQFNTPGGDPAIRALLQIRELATIKSRYINANLYRNNLGLDLFLTNYNVVGTVTGRRGSKKHVFSFGGNAQNFPKHGESAKIYRRCLVVRTGKIFLAVDQIQAEDWPTSCLAENATALQELISGEDRHRKLACLIYNLNWDHYTDDQWKSSLERYIGKKTRHANNYGMRGQTMSDSLAKEGFSLTPASCQYILDKVNQIDPTVDGVFHKYIKTCLFKDRTLRTPFGRERQFFGMRAGEVSSNNKIFNEAYSYIPQSVVGDNTGAAVFALETVAATGSVLQESHDSIIQEIPDTLDSLWTHLQKSISAFDRKITFHNGLEIKIPIEGEISYDFDKSITLKSRKNSKKLEDITYPDLQAAYYKLQEIREKDAKEITD